MIEGFATGIMGANCYLFTCPVTKKAALIDPGAESPKIYRWVLEKGLEVEYILLTHGHVDHIGAIDSLREQLKAKVAIHGLDAAMLTDGAKNLSSHFGPSIVLKAADELLTDGQMIHIGDETVTVLATPGHTPGGVCYLTREGIFSGDTLFADSIGRTDFPGGSLEQLLSGIQEKLFVLPDDTKVFPGHGPATTIGKERKDNPFLV